MQKFVFSALTFFQSTSVPGMPALDSPRFWNELFGVADLEAYGPGKKLGGEDEFSESFFSE